MLWAGGEAGQIYRVDLEARTAEEAARAPGFVLGLAVDGQGRLAVCCGDDGLCVVDAEGGVRMLRDGFTIPNYPAFAPTAPSTSPTPAAGRTSDGHVLPPLRGRRRSTSSPTGSRTSRTAAP